MLRLDIPRYKNLSSLLPDLTYLLKKGVKLESIRVSDFAITLITDKLIVFMHLKSSILYANLERF